MKKFIFFILFCSLTVLVCGQSNIRVNNFWQDTYFINPASMHMPDIRQSHENYWQFSIAARKQWTNFPGAPATGVITGTTFFDKFNTQLGISIVEDNIGYTNTLNAKISYSYMHEINNLWNIRFGLALCGQNKYYDFSKVTTENSFNLPANTVESISKFNADFGIELAQGNFILGVSGQNLFSLFDPINNNIFVNSNFLYTTYRINSTSYVDYSFGLAAIQSQNILQMEGYLNLFLKTNSNAYGNSEQAFNIGLYYRTWNEIGLLFGIHFSEAWYLSYAYDYNVGSVSQRSLGTHELILRYRLQPKYCSYKARGIRRRIN